MRVYEGICKVLYGLTFRSLPRLEHRTPLLGVQDSPQDQRPAGRTIPFIYENNKHMVQITTPGKLSPPKWYPLLPRDRDSCSLLLATDEVTHAVTDRLLVEAEVSD